MKSRVFTLLQDAATHQIYPLRGRLTASFEWIRLARRFKHGSLDDAYAAALEIAELRLTISRNLEAQQVRQLEFRTLASDAAALAIGKDDVERAVEILEQGRGAILLQLGRYRTPLEDLRAVDQELADSYTAVSFELEKITVSIEKTDSGGQVAQDGISR